MTWKRRIETSAEISHLRRGPLTICRTLWPLVDFGWEMEIFTSSNDRALVTTVRLGNRIFIRGACFLLRRNFLRNDQAWSSTQTRYVTDHSVAGRGLSPNFLVDRGVRGDPRRDESERRLRLGNETWERDCKICSIETLLRLHFEEKRRILKGFQGFGEHSVWLMSKCCVWKLSIQVSILLKNKFVCFSVPVFYEVDKQLSLLEISR